MDFVSFPLKYSEELENVMHLSRHYFITANIIPPQLFRKHFQPLLPVQNFHIQSFNSRILATLSEPIFCFLWKTNFLALRIHKHCPDLLHHANLAVLWGDRPPKSFVSCVCSELADKLESLDPIFFFSLEIRMQHKRSYSAAFFEWRLFPKRINRLIEISIASIRPQSWKHFW